MSDDAPRTADTDGRPYAKLSELKDGQAIWLDGGFTCHAPGHATVHILDDRRPFFSCHEGSHYLDGQADDGEHCIGVYTADPGPIKWEYET